MIEFALLMTAMLFGGMVLYSFGFAAFVFNALPVDTGNKLLRKACPHFYLFVLVASAISAALAFGLDTTSAAFLAFIAATVLLARQILMPMINAATDAGVKRRFKVLHTLSALLMLSHIAGRICHCAFG